MDDTDNDELTFARYLAMGIPLLALGYRANRQALTRPAGQQERVLG